MRERVAQSPEREKWWTEGGTEAERECQIDALPVLKLHFAYVEGTRAVCFDKLGKFCLDVEVSTNDDAKLVLAAKRLNEFAVIERRKGLRCHYCAA